jgi:cytochrome c oxidase subunit 3
VAWGKTTIEVWRGLEVRLSVELCAVYWHFLLVVWLGLFVLMLTH